MYLDVAMRRFFIMYLCSVSQGISGRTYDGADGYRCTAADGMSKLTPKSYIRDIYYTSVYSPELFGHVLY